jgi:hypothetical protein
LYGGVAEDLGSRRLLDHKVLLGYWFLVLIQRELRDGSSKVCQVNSGKNEYYECTRQDINKITSKSYISIWHGIGRENKM